MKHCKKANHTCTHNCPTWEMPKHAHITFIQITLSNKPFTMPLHNILSCIHRSTAPLTPQFTPIVNTDVQIEPLSTLVPDLGQFNAN